MEKIVEPTPLQFEFSLSFPSLVLASSSPNRKALIEKGGTILTTFTPHTSEDITGYSYEEGMKKNAKEKLENYLSSSSFIPTLPAVSCDTLVLIENNLLGKPKDIEDAYRDLKMLSGKRQTVLTGCSVYFPNHTPLTFCDKADVIFRCLTDIEIKSYLEKDEWIGAAGGYRLQKTGYTLVERIEGDWTTVVGFPMKRLISLANSLLVMV